MTAEPPKPTADGTRDPETGRQQSLRRRLLVWGLLLLLPTMRLAETGSVSIPRVLLGAGLLGGLLAVFEWTRFGDTFRKRVTRDADGRAMILTAIALAAVLVGVFVAVLGEIVLEALFGVTVPVGVSLVAVVFAPLLDGSTLLGAMIATIVVDLHAYRRSRSSTP